MKRYRRGRNEFIDEDSDPLSLYEAKELNEILNKALLSVSPRARKIIRHRFGFGAPELSLVQIAEKLKLSKSRIQRIEKEAYIMIVEAHPELALIVPDRGRIRKSGRFRINERVQVIGDDSTFYGFGKIVGFQKLFFSYPNYYPEIELDSGKLICAHNVRIYKERDSFRIADRIFNDLFAKEKNHGD